MRTRWFVVAAACTLVLAGCTEAESTDPEPVKDVVANVGRDPLLVDPGILGDAGRLATRTVSEEDRRVHVTSPEIVGAEALTRALGDASAKAVAEFKADHPAPSGDAPVVAQLNGGWRLAGSSPAAIGVLTDDYVDDGARPESTWRTFWFDRATGKVRPNSDLVADPRGLRDALRAALSDEKNIDLTMLSKALDKELPVIAFTEHGELFLAFDEYQIAGPASGLISVVLPKKESDLLLSDFGQEARRSALEPGDPLASATESADPESPTTGAEPTEAPSRAPVDCQRLRCVALTYEDGPTGSTADLLDVYRRMDARATFFVVGQQAATYPSATRRIVGEGHEIAVHTWDHRDLTGLEATEVKHELERTLEEIAKTSEAKPTLMRPPYAATNKTVDDRAAAAGLAEVLWSVDTLDGEDNNPAVVARRAVSRAQPGSIIRIHDIDAATVAASSQIIDGLRGRGFTLVTVTELLGETTPGQPYSRR